MEPSKLDAQVIPPVWPSLLVCAVVAILADFGSFHRGHHADSLVFIQISLYRWTPFFWESDRVGSLVPLLALPFKSPLTNLLVQGALYIWFTLAGFVMLARYMLRDSLYPYVGLISAAAFLGLTPHYYRSEIALSTYGVWLVLTLWALLLIERKPNAERQWPRVLFALILLIIAHWAYCTAAVFIAPLLFFRWLICTRPFRPEAAAISSRPGFVGETLAFVRRFLDRELVLPMLLLAASCGAGFIIREMYMYPAGVEWGTLPVNEWGITLQRLLLRTWDFLQPPHWPYLLAALSVTGIALQILRGVRKESGAAFRAAAALIAASLVITAFITTRKWMPINHYMFRYLAPSVLLLQMGIFIVGVVSSVAAMRIAGQKLGASIAAGKGRVGAPAAVPRRLVLRTLSFAGATLLLILASLHTYGLPSRGEVRRHVLSTFTNCTTGVDMRRGIRADDVIAGNCTHIAGHYWQTWPAVLATNTACYERGIDRTVWGISLRDSPTRKYWSNFPLSKIRVAVMAGGDPGADHYLHRAGFPPMELAEKRGTIWILKPKELPPNGSESNQPSTLREYIARHEAASAVR